MGVSYVWACDERKEYIDPYPLDAPVLFAWCQAGGDWYGCKVRLLDDGGGGNGEFYLRTSDDAESADAWGGTMADTYRDVSAAAVAHAKVMQPWYWLTREGPLGQQGGDDVP